MCGNFVKINRQATSPPDLARADSAETIYFTAQAQRGSTNRLMDVLAAAAADAGGPKEPELVSTLAENKQAGTAFKKEGTAAHVVVKEEPPVVLLQLSHPPVKQTVVIHVSNDQRSTLKRPAEEEQPPLTSADAVHTQKRAKITASEQPQLPTTAVTTTTPAQQSTQREAAAVLNALIHALNQHQPDGSTQFAAQLAALQSSLIVAPPSNAHLTPQPPPPSMNISMFGGTPLPTPAAQPPPPPPQQPQLNHHQAARASSPVPLQIEKFRVWMQLVANQRAVARARAVQQQQLAAAVHYPPPPPYRPVIAPPPAPAPRAQPITHVPHVTAQHLIYDFAKRLGWRVVGEMNLVPRN